MSRGVYTSRASRAGTMNGTRRYRSMTHTDPAMSSLMTEGSGGIDRLLVIDNGQPVSAYTDQTRRAVRQHRYRRRAGIHRLTIDVTDRQLSRLEERGYLDAAGSVRRR
jgi:hypothetical protein